MVSDWNTLLHVSNLAAVHLSLDLLVEKTSPVGKDVWRQRVDGVCDLLPALWALEHLPLVVNILKYKGDN